MSFWIIVSSDQIQSADIEIVEWFVALLYHIALSSSSVNDIDSIYFFGLFINRRDLWKHTIYNNI